MYYSICKIHSQDVLLKFHNFKVRTQNIFMPFIYFLYIIGVEIFILLIVKKIFQK